MDYHLPDMHGLAATVEIRRREGDVGHTPIIGPTFDSQKSSRERCLNEGLHDYVLQPVELGVLSGVLAHWTPIRETGQADFARTTPVGTGDPILDPGALARILRLERRGEPSLLGEMIEAFRVSTISHLTALQEALYAGDCERVVDHAHAVNGAAASLGAERVRRIALDLEGRGRQRTLIDADVQLLALETACVEALAALSEHRRIQLEESV